MTCPGSTQTGRSARNTGSGAGATARSSRNGFKVRVVHCWWTFDSVDDARAFLGEAFGEAGQRFGEALTRPRLSYNVAIYHRTIGGTVPGG